MRERFHSVENVTIFKELDSPPQKRQRRGRSVSSRSRKKLVHKSTPNRSVSRSRTSRTSRKMGKSKREETAEESNSSCPKPKPVVTRSRTVRHSKLRTARARTEGLGKGQNSQNGNGRLRRKSEPRFNAVEPAKAEIQNAEENTSSLSINTMNTSSISVQSTAPTQRKSLSAIRKPSASVRRMSMYSNPNAS